MTTKEKVFKILFEASDYVNGEEIAVDLDISRTSVWKAVKALERDGILIDSVKNRGYRLIAGDLLDAKKILEASPKLRAVEIIKSSQSTQADAKMDLSEDTLYLANEQGHARGRFGREFYSEKGRGIYMSLVIKPHLLFDEMPQYTVLTAAAVVCAIKKLTGIETEIKWVNDIYLNGKKLAGILTEAQTDVESKTVTDLIIGIGLNFSIQDFPDEIKDKVTSLFKTDAPITRNQLIAEIWNQFFELMDEDYLAIYKKHSLVLGRDVSYKQGKTEYEGRAVDINDRGELIVDTQEGLKTIGSGEISLSKW
ncbi:bifunctional biotin--[acetyl-CoA-carboxylase] ligase/biotin operon repressor BirA [Streptococcaceae bacterium ESL0687]|nr:bifunctional biotin--[acetyl-CoA-carboxylase] ligase/biotin operon repressor BirA [Streptococcaceae bacterium ESL0687]